MCRDDYVVCMSYTQLHGKGFLIETRCYEDDNEFFFFFNGCLDSVS